jgi:hypothetical protein
MSQVQIVPNSKTGTVITAYKNNAEYGYVQLQQTAITVDGGWVRESKRSTLLRAKMDLLTKFIGAYKSLQLPGAIVVKEYLESEVPQAISEKFFNKELAYEDAIAPYVKRAGADGIELTVGGERILRFTSYDANGSDTDVKVAHDNVVAVLDSKVLSVNSAMLG